MTSKCDFYVIDDNGSMEWLGSSFKDGDPVSVPLSVLIQINKVTFEENVIEYLQSKDGVITHENCGKWPWAWDDSRMTEYSYIFDSRQGKVFMSEFGGNLLDPVKIVQGYDVVGADVGVGPIKFPIMKKIKNDVEEILKQYGLESTEVI